MGSDRVDRSRLLIGLGVLWILGAGLILLAVSPQTVLGWVLVASGAPVVLAAYALLEGVWTELLSRFEESRLGRRLDERARGRPVSGLRVLFALAMVIAVLIAVFGLATLVVTLVGTPEFWLRHFRVR